MNGIHPAWLAATEFLDYRHPAMQAFVAKYAGGTAKEQALRLYYAVRDGIEAASGAPRFREDAGRHGRFAA